MAGRRNKNIGLGTWKGLNPLTRRLAEAILAPLVGCWRLLLEVADAQHLTDVVEREVEELGGLLHGVDVFAIHASP